jgi:hypothetical protein
MAGQGINIQKYLTGKASAPASSTGFFNKASTGSTGFFGKQANGSTGFFGIGSNYTVNKYSGTNQVIRTPSSWKRIVSYVLAILLVVIILLLFINYFITPIFKLKPGGPGIIPIPGFDDGQLYWNKTSAGMIPNDKLPIVSQTYNYTINLDVFIENPLQFSKHPRLFFSRGAIPNKHPSGDTLLGLLMNYNLIAALLPDTNDIIVSVLNQNTNEENVIISNVPVQQPFRLTMVVMEQALEVYINGQLIKTRTFLAPPKDVKGDIYPAMGIEANIIKLKNLKIWSRLLTTGEIREATPTLGSPSDFGASSMASSTSCMAGSSTTVQGSQDQQQAKVLDRISKLSVDTVPDLSAQSQ